MANHNESPSSATAHYTNGFYLPDGNSDICRLKAITLDSFPSLLEEPIDEECPFCTGGADLLLMGSCTSFALALYDFFKYNILAVRDCGRLLHCFCTASSNGRLHFIDVRGTTSSLNSFTSGVSNLLALEDPVLQEIDPKSLMGPCDFDDVIAYKFSCEIIKEYRSYYLIEDSTAR